MGFGRIHADACGSWLLLSRWIADSAYGICAVVQQSAGRVDLRIFDGHNGFGVTGPEKPAVVSHGGLAGHIVLQGTLEFAGGWQSETA